MIIVGIDPGLTGAVAAVDSSGTCTVEDMPTIDLPGTGLVRRRVDGLALARILRNMVPAGHACLVVVEDVQAMGGSAVQTMGSMMRSVGTTEAAVEILRMPIKRALPRTWKKFFGLGKEKVDSLRIARELYPTAPLKLGKHHNRAEALLLAHFGQAMLT
jgi:hypothetical protein